MSYRVIKTIKGRQYVYEQNTYRKGGRVRTRSRYVAPLDPRNRTERSAKVNTTLLSRKDVERCLETKEFEAFLERGSRGRFPVGILPNSFKSLLPFKRREVMLSAETKEKITQKRPEIGIEEYRAVQEILENGEHVRDKTGRANAAVIFHRRDGKLWRLVIKCTEHGEAYLLTYHRAGERHYQNAKKLS